MADPINGSNFFLQSDDKRKPFEESTLSVKAKARAPVNMALYDANDQPTEVLAHVLRLAEQAHMTYLNQRSSLHEKWTKADEFYWMAQKDFRLDELTNAKVSASVFHRVCRRLSDGAYLASFQEEQPVKFTPETDIFDSSDNKRTRGIACDALNQWALWCMRRTKLKEKAQDAFHRVYKYGNVICYVPFDYEIQERKRWGTLDPNETVVNEDQTTVYRHSATGAESDTPHPVELDEQEYDFISKNEVGFYPLRLEDCFLDNRIDDLDRQTAFLWRTDCTRPEICGEAKAGKWANTEKITELHKFQQYNFDNQVETGRITDAGKTTTDSMMSEMYERWQGWMLLPDIEVKLNKKGEVTKLDWDQNGESRRYLLEVIGPLGGPNVVVRFCESPYWGDGIPFIAAHSHKDDSGFYHRGLVELLEDNMIQERVTKGQLMDNRSLLNRRPMIRLIGRVRNKDMRITQNTVFDCTSTDAIKQLDVSDLTGNIQNTLNYLSDDSEKLAQTPQFMLGDAMGARTSATEFATIRDSSSAPALNDIKNLNLQITGGYMRKLKEYAPQFLDRDVITKVVGPNGGEAYAAVTSDEFAQDMNVQEVSVQEFENKSTMRQILINLVGLIANPVFAPFINIGGFLERIFYTFKTAFPNPEELFNKDEQVMATLRQYIAQQPPPPQAPNPQLPGGGVTPAGMPPGSTQGGPTFGPASMGGVTPPITNVGMQGMADAQMMQQTGGASRGV